MRTSPFLTGIQWDYLEKKDEVIIEKKQLCVHPMPLFPQSNQSEIGPNGGGWTDVNSLIICFLVALVGCTNSAFR